MQLTIDAFLAAFRGGAPLRSARPSSNSAGRYALNAPSEQQCAARGGPALRRGAAQRR